MTAHAVTTDLNVDQQALENKVKDVYQQVANEPHADYHFAMGRSLAEELGYSPAELDRIPPQAIDSFAGVGNPQELAEIASGEVVLDLGSGSGTDSFIAALNAGPDGEVLGVDMTGAQRQKAERLAREFGFANVSFHAGYIENLPIEANSIDVVISNGVINLSAEKQRVFDEVARVLRPGGRMSISDIVTEEHLPGSVKCDASLWAACIGGAIQQDDYQAAIQRAGLTISSGWPNSQYGFLTEAARNASRKFGVKSVSLLAYKPR